MTVLEKELHDTQVGCLRTSTRALAQADIAAYIDAFYNPRRRHGHLDGISPEQFEAAHKPRRRGHH